MMISLFKDLKTWYSNNFITESKKAGHEIIEAKYTLRQKLYEMILNEETTHYRIHVIYEYEKDELLFWKKPEFVGSRLIKVEDSDFTPDEYLKLSKAELIHLIEIEKIKNWENGLVDTQVNETSVCCVTGSLGEEMYRDENGIYHMRENTIMENETYKLPEDFIDL